MEIRLKKIWQIILLLTAWITYVLLRNYIPLQIVCPFHKFLGINCVGCGGTRMTDSLLHLHFYQALRYNAFIFVTSPFILFMLCIITETIVIKKKNHKYYYIALTLFSIGAIIFMVLRNTYMPFLSPIEI